MHCADDRRPQHFQIRNAVNETISRAAFIRMRRSAVDKASAATSLKSSAHLAINQTISDGHTATMTINKLSNRGAKPQEDGYRRKSSRSLPTSLEEDSFMSVSTPSHRRFVASSRRLGVSHVPHRGGLGGGELDCKQDVSEISGISPAGDVGALPATSLFFIKSAEKTSACNAPGTMATVSSGAALLWNAAVASQLQEEILLQHKIQPNTAGSIVSTCMQNAGLVEGAASGAVVIVRPSSAEASPVVTKAATVDGEVIKGHGGGGGSTSSSTSGSESNKRRKSPEEFTKLDGFAKLDPVDTSPFSRATFTADASTVDTDERTVAAPIYKPKSRLLAAAIADGAVNSVTTEALTFSGLKTTAPVGTAVTCSSPIFVTDIVGTRAVTCTSCTSSRPYTWNVASMMTGGGMVSDRTAASSGIVASPPGASTSAGAFLMASMRAINASLSNEKAASPASMSFVMPSAISPTRTSATSTNIGLSSTIFGHRQSVPHAAPVFAPVTTTAGDVEVQHATADTLDADDDVVILRFSGDKSKSSQVRTSMSGNSSSLPSRPHEQLHSIKSERSTPPAAGGPLTDTFTSTTTTTTTVSVRPSDGRTRTSTETVCKFTKSFPLSAVATPDTCSKPTLKRVTVSQLCDGLSSLVPLASSNISDSFRATHSLSPLDRPATSLSAECAGSVSCGGIVKRRRSAGQRGRPRHSETKSAKYARHHRNKMKSYRMKVYDERDRLRSVVAGQEAELIQLEKELLTLRQKIQHTYLQAPELLKPKLFLLIS